jgi:hypothetical protein
MRPQNLLDLAACNPQRMEETILRFSRLLPSLFNRFWSAIELGSFTRLNRFERFLFAILFALLCLILLAMMPFILVYLTLYRLLLYRFEWFRQTKVSTLKIIKLLRRLEDGRLVSATNHGHILTYPSDEVVTPRDGDGPITAFTDLDDLLCFAYRIDFSEHARADEHNVVALEIWEGEGKGHYPETDHPLEPNLWFATDSDPIYRRKVPPGTVLMQHISLYQCLYRCEDLQLRHGSYRDWKPVGADAPDQRERA